MTDCSSSPSCSTTEDVLDHQTTGDKSPYVVASRRRLAFRPQGVKIKHIAAYKPVSNKNLTNNAESETKPQNTSEKEGLFSKQLMSPMASGVGSVAGSSVLQEPEQKSRRRLVTWSFLETMFFYEGLKQHGKDFDSIAKYLNKKKINKDKEQIRNYYFNAFKIWKAKALIEESDWTSVPRDARELFVVLNGCEWKKRTCAANFDPLKFKALILEGWTTVRVKKKKSMIMIRTPYCPCLLKWIQTERGRILNDKRNTEIPTHLSLKLTPLCYKDRNYVTSCEQNPLLQIQININDKISSIFSLLERKWISSTERMRNEFDVDGKKALVVCLRVAEGTVIHKVLVDINDDSFPMSLNKLKRDYELETELMAETVSGATPSTGGMAEKTMPTIQTAKLRQKEGGGGTIKLSSKEVFDIDEAKIKQGLTKENVGNASLLQLFYLCGMKNEMMLSYEICHQHPVVEPWNLFVSLINRDYGELMSKTLTTYTLPTNNNNVIMFDGASTSTTTFNTTAEVEGDRKKRSEKTLAGKDLVEHSTANIVEEENMQFLQQLKTLNNQNKKPKRQVKVIPNIQANKRFCLTKAVNTGHRSPQTNTNQQLAETPVVNYNNNYATAHTDQSDILNPQPITYLIAAQNYGAVQCLQQSTSRYIPSGKPPIRSIQQSVLTAEMASHLSTQAPIDFSHFPENSTQAAQQQNVIMTTPVIASSSSYCSASKVVVQACQKTGGKGAERECEITGEFSMQSIDSSLSSFAHPIILDSSPSKSTLGGSTLPDDVRNAYEQMLKENSVDYCRNFEQLTRNLDTIHKSSTSTASSATKGTKQ